MVGLITIKLIKHLIKNVVSKNFCSILSYIFNRIGIYVGIASLEDIVLRGFETRRTRTSIMAGGRAFGFSCLPCSVYINRIIKMMYVESETKADFVPSHVIRASVSICMEPLKSEL